MFFLTKYNLYVIQYSQSFNDYYCSVFLFYGTDTFYMVWRQIACPPFRVLMPIGFDWDLYWSFIHIISSLLVMKTDTFFLFYFFYRSIARACSLLHLFVREDNSLFYSLVDPCTIGRNRNPLRAESLHSIRSRTERRTQLQSIKTLPWETFKHINLQSCPALKP